MSTTVALLGDVHGNLPALEKVLSDARARGADAFWNLGDFVGYGPFPEEVVALLRRDPEVVSIAGNYDLRVLKFEARRDKWRVTKSPDKFFALAWAHAQLSADSHDYLASLPTTRRLVVEGHDVQLTHGSPDAVDEILTPDTPKPRLRTLAKQAQARLVACGHSHQAFVRRASGTLFVNPGGCGRPEGGDPRACYALIRIDAEQIVPEIVRVAYDVHRTVVAMRRHGFPESFIEMVQMGKNLDSACAPANPEAVREAVLSLARACDYEAEHTHQVCRLALRLFDELAELHGLSETDRLLLEWGALLHDIGWCEGRRAHHKTARRIILEASSLPLGDRDRAIVALIARYHRSAEPRADHAGYTDLTAEDQRRVRILGGLLRVADGLDRCHESVVEDLACNVAPDRVRVCCRTKGPADSEASAAAKKAGLIEQVFDRPWVFDIKERA